MPIYTRNGATRLSKVEAAAYLGLSLRQVQRLVGAGELAHQRARGKRGDVLLFDEAELDRFREARKSPPVTMPIETSKEMLDRGSNNGPRLTKREAAQLLGVSVRQVLRLRAQGRLACTRVHSESGSLTLFDKAEIEAYKAARYTEVRVPQRPPSTDRLAEELRNGFQAMAAQMEKIYLEIKEARPALKKRRRTT